MGRFNRNTRIGGGVKKDTVKKKKTLEDYFFYVGSSKQASDYEVTANFVINHVKKTFDYGKDIGDALKNLKVADTKLWKTKLKVSTLKDPGDKAGEDHEFRVDYKAEVDENTRRVRALRGNLVKSYALLWERCAKAMQNKIKTRSDFESTISDDPIELLSAIKQHALNFDETQYSMTVISNSVRAFFATVQKENESVSDYTRRFRTSRDIMKSHLGEPLSMINVVEEMKDYDENDQKKTVLEEKL